MSEFIDITIIVFIFLKYFGTTAALMDILTNDNVDRPIQIDSFFDVIYIHM